MNYAVPGNYAAQQTTAPRPNTISTAIEDFDAVLARAESYAERLQKLHDRVNGPRPSEVAGSNGQAAIPHSVIASIHERRLRLVAILDHMEQTIAGLEGGV